jgi:hypothetical protein
VGEDHHRDRLDAVTSCERNGGIQQLVPPIVCTQVRPLRCHATSVPHFCTPCTEVVSATATFGFDRWDSYGNSDPSGSSVDSPFNEGAPPDGEQPLR